MTEIWNIGIDVVDHEKFEIFSLKEYPHFYQRVFSNEEINYCMSSVNPTKKFSGLFAAKEALFKATSPYGHVFISQFGIRHSLKGQPLVFDKDNPGLKMNQVMINNELINVKISISHADQHSSAFAMSIKNEYISSNIHSIGG